MGKLFFAEINNTYFSLVFDKAVENVSSSFRKMLSNITLDIFLAFGLNFH